MRLALIRLVIIALAAFPAASAYCNISLGIAASVEDGKVVFSHSISDDSYPFVIEYWAEDAGGSIIKPKRNTTNLNRKSFALPEAGDTVIIKSWLVSLGCENIHPEGGYAEKTVGLGSSSISVRLNVAGNGAAQKASASAAGSAKDSKMRGIIPFFVITVLALISIVLIWKR